MENPIVPPDDNSIPLIPKTYFYPFRDDTVAILYMNLSEESMKEFDRLLKEDVEKYVTQAKEKKVRKRYKKHKPKLDLTKRRR